MPIKSEGYETVRACLDLALKNKRYQLSRQDVIEVLKHQDDEIARLSALINTPHTDDWFSGVRLEAAHQIERWGANHDVGKAPQDWFWLLGWLSGKAVHAAILGDTEKAKHHTISSAAALLNWYRAMVGDSTAMRPGIEDPENKDG